MSPQAWLPRATSDVPLRFLSIEMYAQEKSQDQVMHEVVQACNFFGFLGRAGCCTSRSQEVGALARQWRSGARLLPALPGECSFTLSLGRLLNLSIAIQLILIHGQWIIQNWSAVLWFSFINLNHSVTLILWPFSWELCYCVLQRFEVLFCFTGATF